MSYEAVTGIDEELQAELAAMYAADQSSRGPAADHSQDAMQAAWEADKARAARLDEIVALHGWPGRSLAGEDGATAAWIITQHADHDPAFQERMLELLQEAVERDEASVKHAAYLTDRVCVNRGRPQIYGTQFGGSAETYGPQPIADRSGLDERRAGVGLEPFAEYEQHMRTVEADYRAGRERR
jgi:hypothetical protein